MPREKKYSILHVIIAVAAVVAAVIIGSYAQEFVQAAREFWNAPR